MRIRIGAVGVCGPDLHHYELGRIGGLVMVDLIAQPTPRPDVLRDCSGHPWEPIVAMSTLDPAAEAILLGTGTQRAGLPPGIAPSRLPQIRGTDRCAWVRPASIAQTTDGSVGIRSRRARV